MDLSKLPRLSNTPDSPTPADPAQPKAESPAQPRRVEPIEVGIGAEVWISIVLGLACMLLGWRFARYSIATLTGKPFDTGIVWMDPNPKAGQTVPYFEITGGVAWTETGIFLFGIAMLLEGIALAVLSTSGRIRTPILVAAISIAAAATAFNLFLCFKLLSDGITPLLSLLVVAFGGYMVFYEVQLLKATRQRA